MDFSVFALARPSIITGNLEKGTNGGEQSKTDAKSCCS